MVRALNSLQFHTTPNFHKFQSSLKFSSYLPLCISMTCIPGRTEVGLKTYIYSSGSREAQRLLFAHTSKHGDIRSHLSGYFDTAIGPKVESRSYREIFLTLGLDEPSQIVFATDNVKEAEAAVAAGWRCCLVDRPGNHALPAQLPKGVELIKTMDQLLKHC